MNGIHNAVWAFTFCYRRAAIFAGPFSTIAAATMTLARHFLWLAVWSGLAARAIDTIHCFARKEVSVSAELAVLARLSDLSNRLDLINARIRDNLSKVRPAGPIEAGARISRLEIMAAKPARDEVLACLEITGLRGYAKTGPYSRQRPCATFRAAPDHGLWCPVAGQRRRDRPLLPRPALNQDKFYRNHHPDLDLWAS